jgi:DNA-binding GntR family transcriptional regulator
MQVDRRLNLAEEVAALVREMIVDGRLPAGERINEVRLAARIGVSRTPLREALSRLVSEGALTEEPRRGMFVRPLSSEEVREIYPIRSILDPAALRLAGIPSTAAIRRLRRINGSFAASTEVDQAIQLDDEFHLKLVEACPNRTLLGLIQQFMWRTRRYELGLMRRRIAVAGAVAAHDRILDALEAGDLETACRELEGNMKRGEQPVLDWLTEREKEREQCR